MSGSRTFRRSLRASAPCFTKPLTLREEDGTKILECHVDGYPRPDIRWEKDGKVVGKSRKVHMVKSGDMCLLQIRAAQAEDFGQYSCIASNIVGTANTHIRLVTASKPLPKNLNGSTPRILSPVRTLRPRPRSMDRSRESVSESKDPSSRGSRSRSASRDTRQNPSNTAMSKLTNLTNSLWKRNDAQKSSKLEIITPSKKGLSKSVEDCRKSRKSFMNKVKIPDIFVAQRLNSQTENASVRQTKTASSVKEKKVNNAQDSSVLKNNINGSVKHKPPSSDSESKRTASMKSGSVKNGLLKSDSVKQEPLRNKASRDALSKTESSVRNKTRGTIASYLKLFESADASTKLKVPENERGSSLKVTKNEKNKDSNSCSQTDSVGFFKLGKFIRRMSSGNTKKNLEVTEIRNFISHLPDPETSKNSSLENGIENHSECLNELTIAEILDANNQTSLHVLRDITGFSLVTGSQVENDITTEKCVSIPLVHNHENKQIVDITGKTSSETVNTNSIPREDRTEDLDVEDKHQVETESDINSVTHGKLVSSKEQRKIPSICVFEIPERCENEINEKVNGYLPEINEEVNGYLPDEEEKQEEQKNMADPTENGKLLNDKPFEGKISYSSPLIEEKCQELLELTAQETTLESDLQRVSSPVESPARIVKGPQSVTVLRGESVTLAISFTGEPVPSVIWMKGGRVLRCCEDGRLSILEGREMSVVTVNDVTADDSGKYVVCVENEGGGDSRFASVAVVGFPEPPGGEPTASEFTDHSLVLSWYGSMYDGGSVVTGYQVEMCTLPDKKWHKVASSVNTSCSVQGLSMGQRYVFRVRAENRYGVSHPSKESKIICLNDYLQYDTSSDEEPEDVPENAVTIENGTLFSERFDLKEEVGKGKFGTVYRCVDLSCGRARAAKVIRCLKMKDKEKVRQEIEIMSRLHHPKLMQVLAAFESGRNMIMVMEFISGGELFERVIADDFVLTEHDCILFMKQICDGVAYMHRNNVLHLDLKPENILCKTRTSHKIKIIDFGLARIYSNNDNLRILFGTPEFVAPEVLSYEPVSPASDMWSVGVICYVLLSGLSPFMGDNDTETYANITRAEMDFDDEAFDEISQDAKDFISGLLVKKIKGRMSAEECLKHPWLATARLVQKRPISTEKLKRFIIRRKWQKSGTAIRALGRMVSLSRSSLGSSCDSYSPLGSPTSSRSRTSLISRSETTESGDSVFSR